MRWVPAVVILCACGRVNFDSVGDGDGGSGDSGDGGALGVFERVALPPGGVANGVVAASSGPTAYAWFLGRGVFRTDDRGATWTECAAGGAESVRIGASARIYRAADTDAFVSSDSCATWTPMGLGIAAHDVIEIGATVYAATDTGLRAFDGTNWSTRVTPLGATRMATIATTSTGTPILVGGTNGVVRSLDGTTWTLQNGGLPGSDVNEIAFAPTDASRVYAADRAGGSSVVRSIDGGQSWTQIHNIGASGIAVSPTDRDFVLVAAFDDLLLTQNGGTGFSSIRSANMDRASPRGFAFDDLGGAYAATARGVFYANPPTGGWQPRFGDLDAWILRGFAQTGSAMYWATDAGVLRSLDAGATYGLTSGAMYPRTSICLDVLAPGTNDAYEMNADSEIRFSQDTGATHMQLYDAGAANSYNINRLATNGTRVFAATGTQVARSDPPWTVWSTTKLGGADHDVRDVAVAPAGTIIAAADVGVFTSSDGGAAFQPMPGLTAARRIAFSPAAELLVGTDDGVWSFTTSGWSRRGLAGQRIYDLLAGSSVWLAATPTGVHVSRDSGGAWTTLPGLEARLPRIFGRDPGGYLLVGTIGYGLYRTPYPQ